MTTPQVDLDSVVSFCLWLRRSGPWTLTAISNDRLNVVTETFEKAELGRLREWVREQNEKRQRNTYYALNPLLRKMKKKAELADVASMDWLHVDIDPNPGEDIASERQRILAMLSDCRGLPKPSAIVFSGGGYQALWRLDRPEPIDGDVAKAEDLKLYNLQIELLLGADRCHNVDRILRLPGTINWPNEKKRAKGQVPTMATALEQHDDRAYALKLFTKATKRQDSVTDAGGGTEATRVKVTGNVRRHVELDELPASLSGRVKTVIVQGKDMDQPLSGQDQSRSAWLLYVCGELVRAEVPDETVYSIITDPEYSISASVLDKGNGAQVHRYACRQIKRAKESVIAPELAEFNDKYALVESLGGRMRIAKEVNNVSLGRREVEFLLPDGFKMTHSNRFVMVDAGRDANGNPKQMAVPLGKWWLSHPERRTFESVAFYPGKDIPGTMNLWRGFAFDAIPGDCGMYLGHLRNVLCRGVEEHYNYLVGWMASRVQAPHLPAQVAVALRGKQGTGKGTFARHFGKLFGTHYKHVVNADHVTGTFNTVLHDAVVCFLDECIRTDKAHVSMLKALITEETFRVEAKGIDNLESRNCTGLIMATNDDWVVCAGLDDRRFFVLDVPDDRRKDTAYFSAMEKQMLGGGYAALLHHLLTYDLSGFNVRQVPATDELRRQQQRSMTPVESFWFQCLEAGQLSPTHASWTGEVIADEFADRFLDGYGRHMTPHQAKTALGMLLSRSGFGWYKSRLRNRVIEWNDSKGRKHTSNSPAVWRFAGLEQCRKAWDKEFSKQDWPEILDDQVDTGGQF